jgi:hypothetical protein
MKSLALTLFLATPLLAQNPQPNMLFLDAQQNSATTWTTEFEGDDWLSRWLNHVSEIQREQPHWVTPVVTVTPRLEQEFRFDVTRQIQPNGISQWNLGYGKGLELIPFRNVEIIIGEPNYVIHNNPKVKDGFADETILLKYRIISRNEEAGNYIVTTFVSGSIPTGSYKNGLTDASVTPTLAGGKGWGNWSVQSTLGMQLPVENSIVIGKTLTWNTALQYHVKHLKLWPELENNYNHFVDGANSGRSQNFLTPGIVLGRLSIHERTAFTVGTGIQIATSAFHTYNHNWILTMRIPF